MWLNLDVDDVMKSKLPSQAYLVIFQPNMGPETSFRESRTLLELSGTFSAFAPGFFLRLITHNRLFVFTTGLWSVTVIEQQSVLSYVYSNQLRLEIGGGGGQEEGRKRHLATVFPHSSSTHMALIETHSHIHSNTCMHTDRLPLSLSLGYLGQCESFSWARVQARHYLLFYTTVQPWSGSQYSSIMALIQKEKTKTQEIYRSVILFKVLFTY